MRDVGIMLDEFHCFASFPHSISIFATRIPMIKNLVSLGDFCPISLVGSLG